VNVASIDRLIGPFLCRMLRISLYAMFPLMGLIARLQENLIIIHVAGTNGKGSVSLKIAKTLELAGYKTGLFVSPHISSFRERMQVNSVPISEQEVEQFMPDIFSLCERNNIPATFFEVTTGLAFAYFGAHNVEAVVLETGLGGRLDATNVIKHPSLSIITSIGLEHTNILGDTVELIAKEKAGKWVHLASNHWRSH